MTGRATPAAAPVTPPPVKPGPHRPWVPRVVGAVAYAIGLLDIVTGLRQTLRVRLRFTEMPIVAVISTPWTNRSDAYGWPPSTQSGKN